MHRKNKNNILLSAITILIAATVLVFFLHNKTPPTPQAECPYMDEIPFSPPDLKDIVDDSAVIAKGTLKKTKDHYTALQVSEVLKSDFLRQNETLRLCQSNFNLTKVTYGDEVIVFLKGKDIRRNVWSGSWQSYSTAPISEGQAVVGENAYSLDYVRKTIAGSEH